MGFYVRAHGRETARVSRQEARNNRERIIRRARWCCEICEWGGRQYGADLLNVHHIRPVSQGGHGGGTNLIALCPNCHALIHYFSKVKMCYESAQPTGFTEEVQDGLRRLGYRKEAAELMILILTKDVQINKRGEFLILGPRVPMNHIVGEQTTYENKTAISIQRT